LNVDAAGQQAAPAAAKSDNGNDADGGIACRYNNTGNRSSNSMVQWHLPAENCQDCTTVPNK
jgi:hypothetical protein